MLLSRALSFDPWRELDRMQREVNRLFEDTLGFGRSTQFPAVNLYVKGDAALIEAELPGYGPEDLEISVLKDELQIRGKKKKAELPEDTVVHRRECNHDQFARVFQLPFPVEEGKVEAHFKNGLLTIELPRAEADKPRKIQVMSK